MKDVPENAMSSAVAHNQLMNGPQNHVLYVRSR